MEVAPRVHVRRWEVEGDTRYLTFSCRARLPLFKNDAIKDAFVEHLIAVRNGLSFRLLAYVVMPEHVHLLLRPDVATCPVRRIVSTLKTPFARRVIARWRTLNAPILVRLTDAEGLVRFWERGGGYDRNIRDRDELFNTLNYIHRNPVSRGLVGTPVEWRWSSARWYTGQRDGVPAMDEWR